MTWKSFGQHVFLKRISDREVLNKKRQIFQDPGALEVILTPVRSSGPAKVKHGQKRSVSHVVFHSGWSDAVFFSLKI